MGIYYSAHPTVAAAASRLRRQKISPCLAAVVPPDKVRRSRRWWRSCEEGRVINGQRAPLVIVGQLIAGERFVTGQEKCFAQLTDE